MTTAASCIARIVVFKNGMDDHPYTDFFSVDLRGRDAQFLSRLGTYPTMARAVEAAYALSQKTGSEVVCLFA